MTFNPYVFIIGIVYFLKIVSWLIIIRVIISWVAPMSHHPFVIFVVQTTEVVIDPIRKMLPRGSGTMSMVDWSPLIALIVIDVLRYVIIRVFG